MTPNELPKKGAALIGWEPRGGIYVPVTVDDDGYLQTVIQSSIPLNVNTLTQKFPIQETITYPDVVIPAGGAYQPIGFCELLLGEWCIFFQNVGANSTTNLRIIGYPGDPALPVYLAAGVQNASGAYALVAGATGMVNTIMGTFTVSASSKGGPRWIKVELSSTLGTTIRMHLVRQKTTNP